MAGSPYLYACQSLGCSPSARNIYLGTLVATDARMVCPHKADGKHDAILSNELPVV